MATEPTFYSDERGVRVTPTRLIIGSTTYAMANISSIRTERRDPSRRSAYITALIGLGILIFFAAIGVGPGIGIGVIVLGAGLAWAFYLKPTYNLKLTSASGETDALSSKDKDYIDHIAIAINEALIRRG